MAATRRNRSAHGNHRPRTARAVAARLIHEERLSQHSLHLTVT